MLPLHTDVFLTTRETVLQLRAGPGPPQTAVLLHRDPFSRWPSPPIPPPSGASGIGGGR